MTRIETFTDAAFAFTLTLLVISLDGVPRSIPEMLAAMKHVPAFAACVFQLMMFWWGHHTWSRNYGLEDTATIWYSFILVFCMLVYVYPMKAIYSLMFRWISGGWFPSIVAVQTITELRHLFAVYAICLMAGSGVMVLLYRHAWGLRENLDLNAAEVLLTRGELNSWRITFAIATVAMICAFVLPAQIVFLSGMVYFLMAIVLPWHGAVVKRRLRALSEEAA